MKISRFILAAAVLCVLAAAAVPPPKFAGTWKLNNGKSTPDGPADRVYVTDIKQDPAGITVSTKATPAPPQPPLDGRFPIKEKPTVTTQGGHYHSQRVFFEGATLVFEIVDRDGSEKKPLNTKVIRESWVISSADGKTMTRFRRTAAAGSVVDQKYVFERQ